MAGLMSGYGHGAGIGAFSDAFWRTYNAGLDRKERRQEREDRRLDKREDLARQTAREDRLAQGLMSMVPGFSNADPVQQQQLLQTMTPEVAQLMYQQHMEAERNRRADEWKRRDYDLRKGTADIQRQTYHDSLRDKEIERAQDQRDALGTAQLLGMPEMAGHLGGNRDVTAMMRRPMSAKGIREAVGLQQKGIAGAGLPKSVKPILDEYQTLYRKRQGIMAGENQFLPSPFRDEAIKDIDLRLATIGAFLQRAGVPPEALGIEPEPPGPISYAPGGGPSTRAPVAGGEPPPEDSIIRSNADGRLYKVVNGLPIPLEM